MPEERLMSTVWLTKNRTKTRLLHKSFRKV